MVSTWSGENPASAWRNAPKVRISKPAPAKSTSASATSETTSTLRGRNRLRSVLVVSEVALALVLLAGAGLLIRTFGALRHADAGFSPDHVLTMEIQVTHDEGEGHENRIVQF